MKKPILLILLSAATSLLHANTPYITRVYEYTPAPGQFINTLPAVTDDPAAAAEAQLANNAQGMVCLGAWGGYIIFGFDHPVVNVQGEYDLLIEGNAFYQSANDSTKGSSEPGIVCVSQDTNGNGLPDDLWYELQGSEHTNPLTITDYQITYYRTPADHVATPDGSKKFFTDTTYIAWRDNQGNTGYIPQVAFHKQAYFPDWLAADSLTFSGTLLPPNGVDEQGTGAAFVMTCYDYGYADANPNNSDRAKLNLDWAMLPSGSPANLTHIDFVKVYTGVYQICGMQGEVSTEITGAQDLHPDAAMPSALTHSSLTLQSAPQKLFRNGAIYIRHNGKDYTITGVCMNN